MSADEQRDAMVQAVLATMAQAEQDGLAECRPVVVPGSGRVEGGRFVVNLDPSGSWHVPPEHREAVRERIEASILAVLRGEESSS